jgi:predicted secreted protein
MVSTPRIIHGAATKVITEMSVTRDRIRDVLYLVKVTKKAPENITIGVNSSAPVNPMRAVSQIVATIITVVDHRLWSPSSAAIRQMIPKTIKTIAEARSSSQVPGSIAIIEIIVLTQRVLAVIDCGELANLVEAMLCVDKANGSAA